MSAGEARSWWAEVEDVRARIEARRAADDEPQPRRLTALDGGRTVRPAAMDRQHLTAVLARGTRRTVRLDAHVAPAPRRRRLVDAPPAPAPHAERPAASRPAARRAPRTDPDWVALWAVMGSAHAATNLGDRTLKAPMEGRDVRQLQGRLKALGLLHAPATAHFGTLTKRAVTRFQRSRCLTADGIAGPETISAIVGHAPRCSGTARTGGTEPVAGAALRHTRVVTWYGPGWYGRSTACGRTLTRKLIGLAHRTLPCGTTVTLAYGGHVVRAVVVDRGPYAAGVDYDLTWGAARKLGVLEAGRASVRSSR